MGMTNGNVSIANSGVTLLEIVPIEPFQGLVDPLLEKERAMLLKRGKGI
jgi:hypothetical protein